MLVEAHGVESVPTGGEFPILPADQEGGEHVPLLPVEEVLGEELAAGAENCDPQKRNLPQVAGHGMLAEER